MRQNRTVQIWNCLMKKWNNVFTKSLKLIASHLFVSIATENLRIPRLPRILDNTMIRKFVNEADFYPFEVTVRISEFQYSLC